MSTKAGRRATRKVSKCKSAGKRLYGCSRKIKTRAQSKACKGFGANLVECRWRK